jgi:hypothetical protein
MAKDKNAKPRLLVVEDDAHWFSVFERTFNVYFDIKKAQNLGEADLLIPELEKTGLALSIVDIRLQNDPKNTDGILVLQSLGNRGIPAIATSAFATPEIVRDAFVLGKVTDFWFKGETYNPAQWRNDVQRIITEDVQRPKTSIIDNELLRPYFAALVGFVTIFIVLTIIAAVLVLIAPQYVSLILGLGFLLTILMVVTLALFIGKITGRQFSELVRALLTKKK